MSKSFLFFFLMQILENLNINLLIFQSSQKFHVLFFEFVKRSTPVGACVVLRRRRENVLRDNTR